MEDMELVMERNTEAMNGPAGWTRAAAGRGTRRAPLVGGAASAPLVLASCQAGGAGAPPPASLQPAELSFMVSVNPQDFGHDRVVDQFQKALPQVKVELVHTPQN